MEGRRGRESEAQRFWLCASFADMQARATTRIRSGAEAHGQSSRVRRRRTAVDEKGKERDVLARNVSLQILSPRPSQLSLLFCGWQASRRGSGPRVRSRTEERRRQEATGRTKNNGTDEKGKFKGRSSLSLSSSSLSLSLSLLLPFPLSHSPSFTSSLAGVSQRLRAARDRE